MLKYEQKCMPNMANKSLKRWTFGAKTIFLMTKSCKIRKTVCKKRLFVQKNNGRPRQNDTVWTRFCNFPRSNLQHTNDASEQKAPLKGANHRTQEKRLADRKAAPDPLHVTPRGRSRPNHAEGVYIIHAKHCISSAACCGISSSRRKIHAGA